MNKRILLLLTPKTISYILILIGVLFIVLINKFPIKNSFFDFTIIFLLFGDERRQIDLFTAKCL